MNTTVTNRERQPVTGSVYYYRALEDGAESRMTFFSGREEWSVGYSA